MAKSDTVDYKVKLAIDSKEYRAALRAANAEAKQFKKQQRDAFHAAGKDASDGMGMVISAVKKIAPAFAAGGAAYKVLNTAMKENQSWTDEWARVTESARATYEAFANTLVSGNFSGFFSNMREIISTARDAADALDALGTNKIFNSKELSQLRAEQARLKFELKRDDISPELRDQYRQQLAANSQQQLDVTKSQANQSMQTAAALLVSELAKRGVNTSVEDNIRFNESTGFYEWREGSLYDKYLSNLAKYNETVNAYQQERDLRAKNGTYTPGGGFSTGQWIEGKGNLSDEVFRLKHAISEISDKTLTEWFQLLAGADAAMTSYYTSQGENLEVMRRNPNAAGGGSGGGGNTSLPTPVGSIMEVEQLLAKAKEDYRRAMTDAAREAARVQVEELQMRLDKMQEIPKNNIGAVLTGDLANMQMPSASLPELQFDKNLLNNLPAVDRSQSKSLDDYASALYAISDAFGSVSSAAGEADSSLSSIANIAGSLTNVVTALLPLIALDGAKGLPFPGNIIAVTGFITAALAAISTISNAKFASGGIVGGTSYRGDRLSVNANSGEMILNRIQQRRLFDAISSGSIGDGGGGAAVVRGEDIYVSLSNYMRRSGRRLI
ncbi:MAG TPA: hypothetical protein H9927_05335 [Candidatus Alistipes merdipullorum]|nr:hypothetical protein [Candidatus Alistipes merdipullorum]